jgi:hypothetical protein
MAARNPPSWKFAYHAGRTDTNYIETQPSLAFTAKDVDQKSAFQEFHWTYFLLPPYLDITLAAQHTGLQYETPEDPADQFQYITAMANIGAHIPFSDFFQLKLVFEYFYTTMIVQDNQFGFRNLRGYQVYPELEVLPFGSTMFAQITPYFKVPLWSDVGNRQETTIGLKWKIPLFAPQEQRFPSYAYQRSVILRVFYTQMNLAFARAGYIQSDMEVKQFGATLGFSF